MSRKNKPLTFVPKSRETLYEPHSPSPSKKRGSPDTIRVLCTNLVYAIGLQPQICYQDILSSPQYFGKYGKVLKVVVNKRPNANRKQSRNQSYSAVITYEEEVGASLAVISLFEFRLNNSTIRCCYGCSKYCESFFYGKSCNVQNCVYIHQFDVGREIRLGYSGEQDYNFDKHFCMATDIIFDSISTIIQIHRKHSEAEGVFPQPYTTMKVLIDQGYVSYQGYQQRWQSPQEPQREPSSSVKQTPVQQLDSESQGEQVQQVQQLDMEESICDRIMSKLHKRIKEKSRLEFVENKPCSPRFIEQFRTFFNDKAIKQM